MSFSKTCVLCNATRSQRPQGGKNQRHASKKKISSQGLETKPEILWEDWDLQRESTKTLVLKNIHSKLQKLHVRSLEHMKAHILTQGLQLRVKSTYLLTHTLSLPPPRPPVSQFFTTLIPQTIVISPGTSFSMPVTFRPLQRVAHRTHTRTHTHTLLKKWLFLYFCLDVCLIAPPSVSMRTALNFKEKTGAFKCPSVPPFPVVPWRCRTPSCCHSALFNTPHILHSCSETSGTNDCVLFSCR